MYLVKHTPLPPLIGRDPPVEDGPDSVVIGGRGLGIEVAPRHFYVQNATFGVGSTFCPYGRVGVPPACGCRLSGSTDQHHWTKATSMGLRGLGSVGSGAPESMLTLLCCVLQTYASVADGLVSCW